MVERLSLSSRGADDVESTWRRVVPSARLNGLDRRRVSFDWTSLALPGLSVVGYDLAASVRSAVEPHDQLMACRVVTTEGWVGDGRSDLDPGSPWLAGERGMRAGWHGRAHVRALVFDRAEAERTARRIVGDDRLALRVSDPAPHDVGAARRWEHAYRYVRDALVALAEDDLPAPVWEAELRRHAFAVTLAAFPTTFRDALDRSAQRRAAPATVRRAMSFIEAHAHEPITVDDIAAAARISTRGLQYAFRRATGMAPTEFLRDVRLAGAHVDLQEGADTVGAVARRWGFGNPSRFAGYYRARYGRSPADTARRG